MRTRSVFRPLPWFILAIAFPVVPGISSGQELVTDTVHNLSAAGPGKIRSAAESRVCVFCHAPHNTLGMRPLWNRSLPASSYRIYRSSTLDARPHQPTGSSKLCLSCHDGTIALGSVLSRADRIRMLQGDFLPAGLTNLGTDLSDDHPVSFIYDASLSISDPQLANPRMLPPEIKLDSTGALQCTSCHDAHNNLHGDFLVRDDRYGALCTACHKMRGWEGSAHRNAPASLAGIEPGRWPFATVEENACRCCHRAHTAGGREWLMLDEKEEDNCLVCHDGRTGAADIRSELDKQSAHDPRRYLGVHDPREVLGGSRAHVECSDCHNPHAAAREPTNGRHMSAGAPLAGVRGIGLGGMPVDRISAEYELCFRCHGDAPVHVSRRILRQADTQNLRLCFAPSNPSYHPVTTPARSSETISLTPDRAPGSSIRCTDCHNNDQGRRAGGSGPDGPHGSNYPFLLERSYLTQDETAESPFAYALCYKCHRRASILSDESFKGHRLHVQDQHTPCSACHDPHGISTTQVGSSDHTHLINFDMRIVFPEPSSGRIEFRDTGRFSGSCTLLCHGKVHVDEQYP